MRQPGNKLNTIYISERVQERLRPARYAALTVLVAPMGYGKTTAVEWYLQSRERDAAAICVRTNAYSDSVPLFWDGLCRALERAGFAELAGFPCPEDAAGRGLFLELACRTLAGERECVLFLDDFHLLRDRRAAELLCEDKMTVQQVCEAVGIPKSGDVPEGIQTGIRRRPQPLPGIRPPLFPLSFH